MVIGNAMKNFSYVVINRILTTGLHGIFWLIIATVLEPELFGELSYVIAIINVLVLISNFGFSQSIVVFQAKKNTEFANAINITLAISASIAAIVLLPVNKFATIACLGFSFFSMNQANLLGTQQYKKFMFNGLAKSILFLILPISLYFLLQLDGVLLGMAISDLICSFYFFTLLRSQKKAFRDLISNFKVLVHNFSLEVSSVLPRIADKLLIVPLFGYLFTGLYQFNMQILFALEALPVAMYTFLLSEESSGKTHKKLSSFAIILSAIITIVIIIISPIVINEFFPKYSEGILALQVLIITIIPLTLSSILSAKLQAKESTTVGFSIIIRIGSLLGLIIFLGERYELVGVSLAFLISTILNTIFIFILYNKSKIISKL